MRHRPAAEQPRTAEGCRLAVGGEVDGPNRTASLVTGPLVELLRRQR